MELFDTIHARRSYRGPFTGDAVPRADLERIVAAGAAAPTGCNKEFGSFVVVDDPEVRDAIRQLIDKPCVRTAPAFIVVATDATPAYGKHSFELQDAGAAVQNMLLAITALGYATVWLEGLLLHDGLGDTLAGILGIPSDRTARILLPVGRPAEPVGNGPKKKTVAERTHFNRW